MAEAYFFDLMRSADAKVSISDLLSVASASQYQCLFIKDEKSKYVYANDNFIQLMGLKTLRQLQHLTDYELYGNIKEAEKYREHDQYILEESKILTVNEVVDPLYNQYITKTMQGNLYPVFAQSDKANFVLGIVSPESKLLKLDFDTIFKLNQNELGELLVKRTYLVSVNGRSVGLAKMEICTLILLFKGFHAGEIAKELHIKQTTVESYIVHIKNKLSVSNKKELINLIINEKILHQIML